MREGPTAGPATWMGARTSRARSLWGSVDGWSWEKLLEVPQLDPKEDVRADVYWELASGEQVVSVWNAAGFGPGGRGYMLLRLTRR